MVSFCKKKSPVLSFPKSLQSLSLQSGLSAVGVRHDSFYYFPELFPQYRPCNCSSRFACRYCECSPVKHLRVDDHPSFFIVQKLHLFRRLLTKIYTSPFLGSAPIRLFTIPLNV